MLFGRKYKLMRHLVLKKTKKKEPPTMQCALGFKITFSVAIFNYKYIMVLNYKAFKII